MNKPKLSNVVQPTTELYKNKPDMVNELNGYYYIHLHQKNVGRMYEGENLNKGFTDSQIMNKFKKYKNEKMTNVVTNQYLQGVKASIHQFGPYSNLIQNAFTSDKNGNQTEIILDSLQEALVQGFNEAFDTSKVLSLLGNEKRTSFKGHINDLNAFFNNDSSIGSIKKGVNFLDKVLQGLADTVKLIRDEKLGKTLAQILISLKKENPGQIGSDLLNEISLLEKNQLNGTQIQKDEVEAVFKYLKQIGQYLEKGNTQTLNAESFKGLIQNEFYAGMAEFFMLNLKKNAVSQIFNQLNEINFEQMGNQRVELELVNPETGEYTGNFMKRSYFNPDSLDSKESGKADGVAKNVSINLESVFSDGGRYGNLTMDLRISNKAYSTNHFGLNNNNLNEYNDVYGLGGGMLLGQGMDLLFSSNISNKYLAYNVLCRDLNNNDMYHGGGFPQALSALQDALLTRNIVYLAAGRGKQDFSQLLLLNGEIMSMWDIVKYVLNHDVGTSSSKLSNSNQNDPNGQGVYLSIPNRDKLWSELSNPNMVIRTKKTNQKIANKSMHLHIIPKKILSYASQIKTSKNISLKS